MATSRTTLARSTASRAARVATAAAVGLALAACAWQPGTAATVDGTRVSEETLAETVEGLSGFSPATPRGVLQALVVSPLVLDAASEVGVAASPGEARERLDSIYEENRLPRPQQYADGLVLLVQAIVAQEKAQAEGKEAELVAAVEPAILAADIEINPRYGEWTDRGVVAVPADWFVLP